MVPTIPSVEGVACCGVNPVAMEFEDLDVVVSGNESHEIQSSFDLNTRCRAVNSLHDKTQGTMQSPKGRTVQYPNVLFQKEKSETRKEVKQRLRDYLWTALFRGDGEVDYLKQSNQHKHKLLGKSNSG